MAALDTIKRALRMIGITAEGETPSAAQAEDALTALNGMLAAWEGEGVRLNMAPLALTDTIPLPAPQLDAVAFNLAIRLAAEYGADVRPAIAATAEQGLRALQAAYVHVPVMVADAALTRPTRARWGH